MGLKSVRGHEVESQTGEPKIKRSCGGLAVHEIDGKRVKGCSRCKQTLPVEMFGTDPRLHSGLKSACIACEDARQKESRERNRESCRAAARRWKEKNRATYLASLKPKRKARYLATCEESKRLSREYELANPVKVKAARRRHYLRNREIILLKSKAYRAINRVKINQRRAQKCRENVQFRLAHNMRSRLRDAIVRAGAVKCATSFQIVGCSVAELISHIETQFKPGMTWANWGVYRRGGPITWHIDHIRPCSAFDLTGPEQQRLCFGWRNLQPLWAPENITKSNRLDYAA